MNSTLSFCLVPLHFLFSFLCIGGGSQGVFVTPELVQFLFGWDE